MKKVILAATALALCGIAGQASSTDLCTGSTTASSVSVTTGSFIKQSFTNKCSANVFMGYDEDATTVAICSASAKGNFRFSGSTTTGAVTPTGTKGTAGSSGNTAATIAAGGCSNAG